MLRILLLMIIAPFALQANVSDKDWGLLSDCYGAVRYMQGQEDMDRYKMCSSDKTIKYMLDKKLISSKYSVSEWKTIMNECV